MNGLRKNLWRHAVAWVLILFTVFPIYIVTIVAGGLFSSLTIIGRVVEQHPGEVVVRQADGSWRVPSYHDMPADFTLNRAVNARFVQLADDRGAEVAGEGAASCMHDCA